eukprot:TRINITY_DN11409_c1_g1_i2.p1 TRINITY_DN11409_c1_g1~~TRINITY_DN11409_c1_g1_i2.p1  ORF type:complete len:153 (+),score=7.64 TRINITY_DN11409_c1_g1_i2:2-460(+)
MILLQQDFIDLVTFIVVFIFGMQSLRCQGAVKVFSLGIKYSTKQAGSTRLQVRCMSSTPVRDVIQKKLSEGLNPKFLNIMDESSKHSGHAAMKNFDSPSGETHFRIQIVSQEFEGQNTVKRHRIVYGLLSEELKGPVHALSLETKTPEEHSQ